MKTIVTPVDFTNDSLNALNYAADMANMVGCNLLIVHVCANPIVITEAPVVAYGMEQLVEDAEIELAALKEKMADRTRPAGIKISTVVMQGDIIENIKACCSAAGTYAVVMGRNNASAFDRLLFGSSTVAALKEIGCTLVVVPPGAHFKGIRDIGIACDFREVIETLPTKEIKTLIRELKANLHVLHVSTEPADRLSARTIEESGWFQDMMSDVKPYYHFIQDNNAEDEIIRYADRHELDLLIIIPKKHNFLEKIFQHSHSRQLVLHAHVPVMAMHE